MGHFVLLKCIKKPIEFIFYRLFLFSSPLRLESGKLEFNPDKSHPSAYFQAGQKPTKPSIILFLVVTGLFIGFMPATPVYSFENISLKEYEIKAIKVYNPVDMTRLPINKTFQVNSPDFILQFFFSGPEILGIIFKRNINKSLFVRWCFFRSCEESPFDYVSVIGQPNSPPLANGFFQVNFPPGMSYRFQGLYFFTRN